MDFAIRLWLCLARQDVSLLSAAWRMLHSTVRRVDYIVGLVTTLQDVVRYFMMQPSGMKSDTEDPPIQLVSPYMLLGIWLLLGHIAWPREPCIRWDPDPPMGRGSFEGGNGSPIVKYRDYLWWAVQKQLIRSRCRLGCGLRWDQGIIRWESTGAEGRCHGNQAITGFGYWWAITLVVYLYDSYQDAVCF